MKPQALTVWLGLTAALWTGPAHTASISPNFRQWLQPDEEGPLTSAASSSSPGVIGRPVRDIPVPEPPSYHHFGDTFLVQHQWNPERGSDSSAVELQPPETEPKQFQWPPASFVRAKKREPKWTLAEGPEWAGWERGKEPDWARGWATGERPDWAMVEERDKAPGWAMEEPGPSQPHNKFSTKENDLDLRNFKEERALGAVPQRAMGKEPELAEGWESAKEPDGWAKLWERGKEPALARERMPALAMEGTPAQETGWMQGLAMEGMPAHAMGGMPAHAMGGMPAYAMGGMPAYAMGGMPAYAMGGMPAYAMGGMPAYAMGGMPAYAMGGMPAYAMGGMPAYAMGGMPAYAMGGMPGLATAWTHDLAMGRTHDWAKRKTHDRATGRTRAGVLGMTPDKESERALQELPQKETAQSGSNEPHNKFSAKEYNLDLPELKHTYSNQLQPVNFKKYIVNNKLDITDAAFRPEPNLLRDVRHTITSTLFSKKKKPWEVTPGAKVKQGEYLWPPVRKQGNQFEMSKFNRYKFRDAVDQALEAQEGVHPKVYHLNVYTQKGLRDILMTRVPAGKHTYLSGASDHSDFWLFHEALQHEKGKQSPMLSLLGGMFLPKFATNDLEAANLVRPVGTNWVRARPTI